MIFHTNQVVWVFHKGVWKTGVVTYPTNVFDGRTLVVFFPHADEDKFGPGEILTEEDYVKLVLCG